MRLNEPPEDGAAEDAFCGRITAQEPPKDAPAEDALGYSGNW